jgi:hypothetical protein
MKRSIFMIFLVSALLSACGPKATPTPDPADVQATAVAMAWTMAAQTQAAIPTATPVPTDTPTPPPTETPLPTPTLEAISLPQSSEPTASSGKDPCDQPLPHDVTGPKSPVVIKNQANGPVTLSLYLNKTAFGECGYIAFNIAKNDSVSTELPQGCYSAYGWQTGNKPSTPAGSGLCMNNTDKWEMIVKDNIVTLNSP